MRSKRPGGYGYSLHGGNGGEGRAEALLQIDCTTDSAANLSSLIVVAGFGYDHLSGKLCGSFFVFLLFWRQLCMCVCVCVCVCVCASMYVYMRTCVKFRILPTEMNIE